MGVASVAVQCQKRVAAIETATEAIAVADAARNTLREVQLPVKVKNTFIDGYADDESQELPMITTKTCPPLGSSQRLARLEMLLAEQDENAREGDDETIAPAAHGGP